MIFSFLFIYIFVVNIVYYVVHIVCEVDVIANSLVLYLPFCSTLNKNFFSSLLSSLRKLEKNTSLHNAYRELGVEWNIQPHTLEQLEHFTCLTQWYSQ